MSECKNRKTRKPRRAAEKKSTRDLRFDGPRSMTKCFYETKKYRTKKKPEDFFRANVTKVSGALPATARRDERGKSCERGRTATAKRYGNAVAPREKALQRMTLPKLFKPPPPPLPARVRAVRPPHDGARSECRWVAQNHPVFRRRFLILSK